MIAIGLVAVSMLGIVSAISIITLACCLRKEKTQIRNKR